MKHRKLLIIAIMIFYQLSSLSHAARTPLLTPGKKTIYQRVITHPGARYHARPAGSLLHKSGLIRSFTALYVYSRQDKDEATWLEVGSGSDGKVLGWINAAKSSPWHQAMTLTFADRTGRQPVLFFKEYRGLEQICTMEDPGAAADGLIKHFESMKQTDRLEKEYPLLALEPPREAIPRNKFYLMPIFDTAEPFEGVKFLQVASIDPGSIGDSGAAPPERSTSVEKTGIAFVIDTSISMGPYIEGVRQTARKIYDSIAAAGLSDRLAFGLVAFRNSTVKTPELEYTSRVISDLKDGNRRAEFEKALAEVSEAKASSHSFNEDAFAGLKTAVDKLNWAPYQARIIILATDAGAIRNDDEYSSTGMNESEAADLAKAKGIKLFALHLKTPAGAKWGRSHRRIERQYRTLTAQTDADLGDLYIGVDAPATGQGVVRFSKVVEAVAGQMTNFIKATATGQRLPAPGRAEAAAERSSDPAVLAARKAAVIGYSLQLDYLGRKAGARAPEVITSWIADHDLRRLTPTVNICVLLTKNQLSSLHQQLKVIYRQAQRTKRTGSKDFFQGILSAAAQLTRDPVDFSRNPDRNLQQLGFMAEFLEDLPYRSSVMRLQEEDWYRMSVGEQQAFINTLKSKMNRYREYHNDVDNWEDFGSGNPGEAVYRIPLSVLP